MWSVGREIFHDGEVDSIQKEREREHDLLLYVRVKKVCDVCMSDGEAKGVETKQARLVKRQSRKCGTRNRLASRSSKSGSSLLREYLN